MGPQAEITYRRRRLATLDFGTNSLLLLVAERDEAGRITVLADESSMPRLGEGLRETGAIPARVIDRAVEAVAALVKRAKAFDVDEIIVTGTSAVREASNRGDFLARVKEATGIDVEVLAPNDEARLTYLSVTMELGRNDPAMVADIGGGSTEISWGVGPRFDGGRSLDLGSVKLLEGPLSRDPVSEKDLDLARKEVDGRLSRITSLPKLTHYYGTAGAFTHLAAIDLKLADYHPDRVAGHRLDRAGVAAWVETLASMTRKERLALPGIDPRRADVVLPGTLIIDRLFEKFHPAAFEVRDRGIRFGKLYDRLRKFVPPVGFAG